MVARLMPSSRAMEETVLAGRGSRSRAGPVGVLARELVGEDAEAAGLGQGVLLAVEQLAGGADPGVADQRAGPHGRFGGEKAAGGFGDIGVGYGHTRTVEETAPAGLIDT